MTIIKFFQKKNRKMFQFSCSMMNIKIETWTENTSLELVIKFRWTDSVKIMMGKLENLVITVSIDVTMLRHVAIDPPPSKRNVANYCHLLISIFWKILKEFFATDQKYFMLFWQERRSYFVSYIIVKFKFESRECERNNPFRVQLHNNFREWTL